MKGAVANARGAIGSGLGLTAWLLIAVGLWMAAMPFAGAIVGIPFDGGANWEWNQNRFLLHVLPGLLGAGLGLVLLLADRRRRSEGGEYAAWIAPVAVCAVLVGAWNGLGPWLMEALIPRTAAESALMFHSIPGFASFSGLHQFALEAVCHWLPGLATLFAGWAAFRVSRALPVLRLASSQ